MNATALRLLKSADGVRGVLRTDDDKLTLGLVEDGQSAPFFAPAALERLILFAEHAAAGSPAATTHPKAVMMLATLALAAVAMLDAQASRDGRR